MRQQALAQALAPARLAQLAQPQLVVQAQLAQPKLAALAQLAQRQRVQALWRRVSNQFCR